MGHYIISCCNLDVSNEIGPIPDVSTLLALCSVSKRIERALLQCHSPDAVMHTHCHLLFPLQRLRSTTTYGV
jgi:hypothetical protein